MKKRRPILAVAATFVTLGLLAGCSTGAETQSNDAAAGSEGSGTVTVYLTRHGKTWLNTAGRVQGWSDSPLTAEGQEVASALGAGLKEEGVTFDAVYSADMVRHYETADAVVTTMGDPHEIVRMEGLREISFGGFEGGTNEEMFTQTLDHMGYSSVEEAQEVLGPINPFVLSFYIPDANPVPELPAETGEEAGVRALAALDEIVQIEAAEGDRTVLVVTSGGTIYSILVALGYDMSDLQKGLENASVTKLLWEDDDWTIETVNDTSYIE